MGIFDALDHVFVTRRPEGVERHHHRPCKRQRLELVDEVGHRHRRIALGRHGPGHVVPRRPQCLATRQQGPVGVQPGHIGLIAHRAEDGFFRTTHLPPEHVQRLIAMTGKHHAVEVLCAGRRMQADTALRADHALHRRGQAHIIEIGDHPRHIALGAPRHGQPLRAIRHLQQTVIGAEARKGADRIGEHGAHRARPDRRRHR